MEQEKKLHVQTKLRKEEPKLAGHMMTREDFSSLTNERDALRKARMKGMLDFLYKGVVKSTRLETETESSYIKKMIERAKKHMEAEAGGEAGDAGMGMGMEEPMMEEGKLTESLLSQLVFEVLEEHNNNRRIGRSEMEKIILQEISAELDERRRRPRGWIKPGKWPFQKFPAYWQGVPGKDGPRRVHRNSFRAFYKEVRKNPEARKQLGKRDFHWGDQHSDAYATLQGRPVGQTKVTGAEAAEIEGGIEPSTITGGGGKTPKTELIRKYQLATKKLETQREKNKTIKAEMDKLSQEASTVAQTQGRDAARKKQEEFKIKSKMHRIGQAKIRKLEDLVKGYIKQIKKLDAGGEKDTEVSKAGLGYRAGDDCPSGQYRDDEGACVDYPAGDPRGPGGAKYNTGGMSDNEAVTAELRQAIDNTKRMIKNRTGTPALRRTLRKKLRALKKDLRKWQRAG